MKRKAPIDRSAIETKAAKRARTTPATDGSQALLDLPFMQVQQDAVAKVVTRVVEAKAGSKEEIRSVRLYEGSSLALVPALPILTLFGWLRQTRARPSKSWTMLARKTGCCSVSLAKTAAAKPT